jgi:hypothetical protein
MEAFVYNFSYTGFVLRNVFYCKRAEEIATKLSDNRL